MNTYQKAHRIIRKLNQNGWDAYIVGGAVRDIVLKREPSDIDVVTNAPFSSIQTLFCKQKLSIVGSAHRICIVNGIEVSTYRKNSHSIESLLTDKENSSRCSLKDDLAHRDFTMNALAYWPDGKTIIDECGGVSDIESRVIRFTGNAGDRILEDPCRMIRAARFVAQLNGTIESESQRAIITHCKKLKDVAKERIRLEILKAMKTEKPSLFFDTLHETGLLKEVFPALDGLYGHDGGPYHNESIDTHVKIVGDALPARNPLLRLAGYLHDIGKPASATFDMGILSFKEHDRIGAEIAEKELSRLKFSTKETKYIKGLIRLHMRPLSPTEKPKSLRRTLKALEEEQIRWKDWFLLKLSDKRGNLKESPPRPSDIRQMILNLYREQHPKSQSKAFSLKELAISGKDLITHFKIKEGPVIGKLLKIALESVIEDPSSNSYDTLMNHIKKELER